MNLRAELHRLTLQSLAWDEAAQALKRRDFTGFDIAMSKFRSLSPDNTPPKGLR